MRRWLAILLVIVPLPGMAAQAGYLFGSILDLQAQWSALPVNGSQAHRAVPKVFSYKERVWSFVVAHAAADSPRKAIDKDSGESGALDLRDVDWDKVTAGKNGNDSNVDNGDDGEQNGDAEDEKNEEEGDKEEDEEEGDKEEDEAGGEGWDRLWDAPKLG